MNDQEFDYLSAELAMAQSQGSTSFSVNTKDMQALLHTARLWRSTVGKPKVFGYMSADKIRSMCDGNTDSSRAVRRQTDHRATPVYFIELEGEDLRDREQLIRNARRAKFEAKNKRLVDKGIVIPKKENELQLSLQLQQTEQDHERSQK